MTDTPENDLAPLVEALRRKVTDQESRIDQLENRLAELEQTVTPDPHMLDYEQLTKEQKVHKLRVHLIREAETNQTGGAQLKYREVKALFDGHPSPGHCYDLMEAAAHAEGFAYDRAGQNNNGDKRVRVTLDAVNDDSLFHAANKAPEGTPA